MVYVPMQTCAYDGQREAVFTASCMATTVEEHAGMSPRYETICTVVEGNIDVH
jgi:hypothetical protein